jgi:hypothetical protein
MSKKYVPPFMKDSSSVPSSESQRFHFPSSELSFNSSYKPLVNTSRPAKEAPKLESGTLASLTKQSTSYQPLSFQKNKPVSMSDDKEFPSLGSSKKVTEQTLNTTYASLARRWGEQKKEDEERQKKEAKELAEKTRLEKELAEKERRSFQVRSHSIYALSNRHNDDDDKYDIGCDNRVALDDDSYESPVNDEYVDDDDDDENNEDDQDDGWNRRRNKNDLY